MSTVADGSVRQAQESHDAAIWPYTFRIRVERDAVWLICDLCETEMSFGRMATISELIPACQQHRCHRDRPGRSRIVRHRFVEAPIDLKPRFKV